MLRRRRAAQINRQSVPYGVEKVEYLESSGTQWIATNISTKDLSVEIDYTSLKITSPNGYQKTFGFWGENQQYQILETSNYSPAPNVIRASIFGQIIEFGARDNTLDVQDRTKYSFSASDGKVFMNDNLIKEKVDYNKGSIDNKIYLFSSNNSGGVDNPSNMRIHLFKSWKLKSLQSNLIPTLDKTGTPCMFDKVTRKNFYNAGTGEFSYSHLLPKHYIKVDYLESTGTQWMQVPISTTAGDDVNVSFQGNYTRIDIYQEEGAQLAAHTAPYFQIGLRANGVWCGGVTNFGNSSKNSDKEEHLFEIVSLKECSGVKIDGTFIISQKPITSAAITTRMGIWRSVLPNSLYSDLSFNRKKWWKLTVNEEIKYNLIPCLDPTGTPCMYDTVSQKPFYNSGTGDFLYPSPTSAATYSMRRPLAEYAKMTDTGVRRLYHVPVDYEGSIEEYASENGFKLLNETECPNEEGKYYAFKWVETDTEITTEWYETEQPTDEFGEMIENTDEPQASTFNLRRPAPIDETVYTNTAKWAKMTDTGVHKIYHTPIGYEGSIEDYAVENNYKRLIETESPNEDGKYYSFNWVETGDTLTTEWFEIDPPQEEFVQ